MKRKFTALFDLLGDTVLLAVFLLVASVSFIMVINLGPVAIDDQDQVLGTNNDSLQLQIIEDRSALLSTTSQIVSEGRVFINIEASELQIGKYDSELIEIYNPSDQLKQIQVNLTDTSTQTLEIDIQAQDSEHEKLYDYGNKNQLVINIDPRQTYKLEQILKLSQKQIQGLSYTLEVKTIN